MTLVHKLSNVTLYYQVYQAPTNSLLQYVLHIIGTGRGKLSNRAYLKHGKSKKQGGTKSITYHTIIHIEPDFGNPGAFLITNKHKHRFFLESATLEVQENQIFHFNCRSWVYPIRKTKSDRLFFSNHVSFEAHLFHFSIS